MNFLNVQQLRREEDGKAVVDNISFSQSKSQKLAIAGATGSGKTSLLKMIAGLIQPTAGTIFFEDVRVKGPQEKLLPGHSAIAYLSQHFELRNHYHVAEILDMAKKVSDEEARNIYKVCRIDHLLHRWTHQLSGGERQRIALSRLLVSAPKLLLLDEPFSNLDAIHKNVLKTVIQDLNDSLNLTCLLVSHDPLDLLSWADEILILQDGNAIQQDTPEKIYYHPVNEYAAALMGKYNLLTPELANAFAPFFNNEQLVNRFLRPQNFKPAKPGEGVKAEVVKHSFAGAYYETEVQVKGISMVVFLQPPLPAIGAAVYLTLNLIDEPA